MMKKLNSLILVFFFSVSSFGQIPSGYYNTAAGNGATLKTNLYNIIKNHTIVSYDNLWTAFQTTDDKPDGKVWDMYSNCIFTFGTNQCGNYSNECDCYNREHSWPKSWFGGAVSPMYSDLFHLIPTDGKVNQMRDNFPYGEVSNPIPGGTSGNGSKLGPCSYPGYSGTVFEPIDEYKGDLARNYFYMATRYENLIASWQSNVGADEILNGTAFPCFDQWFLNLLGEWNTADPVSQKEIDRNNDIYTNYQHNRNPYIDHPEYVYSVWGVGAVGTLTATPSSLAGFTYSEGAGPSTSQSYSLSGTSLSPAGGNITVNGTTNYEVSSNNTSFSGSFSIPYTLSSLNATIFVRMKSGLPMGSYSSNLITNAGGGALPVTVSCSGSVTAAVIPEPTNFPTDFSAYNIHLQWTNATGTILPGGYLIRMSTAGFSSISAPVDGVPVANDLYNKNIQYPIQEAWFTNFSPNTMYYFKIFGYTGSGGSIDYKTDGIIPQVQQSTTQ